MSKIGKSKLNIELPIKVESNSSSKSYLTLSSDSSESEYTGTLMYGLLTTRKETIDKIFRHLSHNSIMINFKHYNDKLFITSFDKNETILSSVEINLKYILKYYIPTFDFSYNISTNLLQEYSCNFFKNHIGFSITNSDILFYPIDTNMYFENVDKWLEFHDKNIKEFHFKIPISLSSDYGNELYRNKLIEISNRNNTPIVFQLSNQNINQLYHFITSDKNEFIELKYTKQKLYYKEYAFKNENNNKFELFPNKHGIDINKLVLMDVINIINNEDNSEKILLFYENSLGIWLIDEIFRFKCTIEL